MESKICELFYPCLNNSGCKSAFAKSSCQEIGIESECNHNSMDIYVSKEFAIKLEIRLSDILINENNDSIENETDLDERSMTCKSSLFNKTHIKFNIPYNDCGTKKIVRIAIEIFKLLLKNVFNILKRVNCLK